MGQNAGSNREVKKKHTHEILRNLAKDLAGGLQTPGCCFNYLEHLIFLMIVPLNPAKNGGEGEIRTHEPLTRLLVFKTSAFSHSATSPRSVS